MNSPLVSRPIRVLMTADAIGGLWTYALELAAAAGEADPAVEFTIAGMGAPPSPAQRCAAEAIPGVMLEWNDARLEWMDDPWADVDRAGAWLQSLARAHQPDIVHLNHYSFGALSFDVPVVLVGHSCVCSWWHAVHGEAPPRRFDEYCRRVRAGLSGADLVIAPTCAMLDELHRHYGKLPATRVLNNGRASNGFTPRSKDPIVLAAGRLWDEAKNIHALDEIAPALPWPCLVAGALTHPGGGRTRPRHLVPLGQLSPPDMAAQLSRTAIFAHPARYEPFGLAPLEAALSGCALVLGDIPPLRELWEGAASFVDPDDPEALRIALDELISRPARRARAAAAAWQRAAIYTSERFGTGYAAMYAELLCSRPDDGAILRCAERGLRPVRSTAR